MIAIYSNTGEWGGVDVLIARFAEFLRVNDVSFCIIEPRESRLRRELAWALFVDLHEVSRIEMKVTHVFVPSISKLGDPKFPWLALGGAKVFSWVVHPNDVFRRYFPFSTKPMNVLGYPLVRLLRMAFRPHAKLFDALFKKLVTSEALAVMDGATSRSLSYFVPSLLCAPQIIPIPSPDMFLSSHRRNTSEDLSIGYLGRMDSMKWSAMQPFINHTLAPMAAQRKVTLHVVSEGSHLGRLEKSCTKNEIRFVGYGYLPNDKARKTIISNTDVAVAMGTSALDIAGCGHPCVVLDPSLGIFSRPQMKFRFIYESNDYTLGEYRDFPGYIAGLRTFAAMVSNDGLHSAAARGKSYVEQLHSPEKCFKSLLSAIQNSGLLVSELMPYVKVVNDSFAHTKSSPIASMFAFDRIKAHD